LIHKYDWLFSPRCYRRPVAAGVGKWESRFSCGSYVPGPCHSVSRGGTLCAPSNSHRIRGVGRASRLGADILLPAYMLVLFGSGAPSGRAFRASVIGHDGKLRADDALKGAGAYASPSGHALRALLPRRQGGNDVGAGAFAVRCALADVITYSVLRVRLLGAFAPLSRFPHLTRYEASLSAIALFGQYLWNLLWPVHLCAFYVFHKSGGLLDMHVLEGLGGLLLCTALFGVLWRRGRLLAFAIAWLLATLAPVLNPQWVGSNVFAERYLYLPSVDFCWLAGWSWTRLWARTSSLGVVWRRALAIATRPRRASKVQCR
jgi:hypothetical protein